MRRYKKQKLIVSYPSGREETFHCKNKAEEDLRRKSLEEAQRNGVLNFRKVDA